MKRPFFVFLCLLFIPARLALAAVLFGAEFELSNFEIWKEGIDEGYVNTDKAVAAQRRLLQEFSKECVRNRSCVVERVKNSYELDVYKVVFKDGFWLQISTDPSTVEIQTKPSTVAEFTAAKKHLDHLFSTGEKLGLRPDPNLNLGGHIHMDFASAFGDDHRLFRNFLVDFMNHQELGGEGIFGSNKPNAPHLSLLTDTQKAQFLEVIDKFDSGEIKTARKLATEVIRSVYNKTLMNWSPSQKYQALNLSRVKEPNGVATVEFRALSAQRDADEFLKQIRLFEARVEYLRKLNRSIPVMGFRAMSPEERVAAFRSYVEESGLKWEDYRPLVRNDSALATADITPLSRVAKEPKPGPPLKSNAECQAYFRAFLN